MGSTGKSALGLSSDRVYQWRLVLEEYGPEIVCKKGIHNTVTDAISRLDYTPSKHDEIAARMKYSLTVK